MVNTNILNLQRVDVGTRLLVKEILLHGLVHFFSSHLVLEIATNRFVDFIHVGGDVLSSQDGWCAENTHGLTTVVIRIGGVASSTWIQSVVNGEVSDFVVSGDGLTGCTFVVLDLVKPFKIDEVVVEVVDGVVGVGIKGSREKLRGHGQTGVHSVNGGRNRQVLVEQVIGVPIIAKDGMRASFDRFFRGPYVVVERDVGLVHRTPRIANARR